MLKKLLLWCYKIISKFYIRPQPSGFGLGALKDDEDKKDYSVGIVGEIDIPAEIDMRTYVPEIKSQGRLNSCIPHAICSSIELQINMQDPKRYVPLSELYNYYYGRMESNLFPKDSGTYPRDAIKSIKSKGIALEVAHPYSVEFFNRPPSSAAESVAHIYSALTKEYFRVFTDVDMMEKLALGLPIIISVPVYSYWHYPKLNQTIQSPITGLQERIIVTRPDGIIRKPDKSDTLEGYHALCVVGYDKKGWICLNSWGRNYGDKGFVYLPYGYEMIDKWVIILEA